MSTRTTPKPKPPIGVYCKRCAYDLQGVAPTTPDTTTPDTTTPGTTTPDTTTPDNTTPRCPECGHAFNPKNPNTFDKRKGGSLWRFFLARVLPATAIGLAIVWAVLAGWVPVPGPLAPTFNAGGWTLWHWRSERYGWQNTQLTTASRNTIDARIFYWADNINAVQRTRPTLDQQGRQTGRTTAWKVARNNNTWTVTAEPGTPWEEILPAWNLTRRGYRFGLFASSEPAPPDTPFRYEGDEPGTLTAMGKAWGVRYLPGEPLRPEEPSLWVWDPRRDRIVRVPIELARFYAGYDPRNAADPRHPQCRRQSPQPGWYEQRFPNARR